MSRSVKSRQTAAKLGGPLGVISMNSAASSLRRRVTSLRNAARCLVRSGAPPSPAASQSAAGPSSRARRMPPTPPAATTGLRLAAGGWPERSKTTLHQPLTRSSHIASASSYPAAPACRAALGEASTERLRRGRRLLQHGTTHLLVRRRAPVPVLAHRLLQLLAAALAVQAFRSSGRSCQDCSPFVHR